MTGTIPPLENSDTVSCHTLQRSLISAIKTGVLSIVIGALLAVAYFATLPNAARSDSNSRKALFREWKQNLIAPVAVTTLIILPITVMTARFASTYPPRPVPFVRVTFFL